MAEVIIIPQQGSSSEKERTTRVAAYCRVSSLPQEESYDSQVQHFTSTISAHPDWALVKVYGDEGVTGLNTIKRKGFKQMLKDGKAGKFDLLLVKSISRLGRNTVDLLQSVRELRSAGVTCFFEKESIRTDASAGELMITLLSAFAQMESESISQNVRIGLNYKMQRGEWSVAYSNFLGYDRTPEGEVVINLEEAKTVRLIFDSFLSGRSLGWIVKEMIEKKMRTGSGGLGWNKESVRRILQNRKYSGDVILQVTVTEDLITKKRAMNTGQAPQYIVVDGIPAIISRQTYFLAQGELERRGRMIYKNSSGPDVTLYKNGFTGKLKCSVCGANYNRANARNKYVWKCYERIHGECKSPILPESELEDAVLRASQCLWDLQPQLKFNQIPTLTEENTLTELESAAKLHMENIFTERIASLLASPRPSVYSPQLLDIVEKIEFTDQFNFCFHTGIKISVERHAVKCAPVESNPQIQAIAEHTTHFGVTGNPRRRLVKRLSELTGEKVSYLGFPSLAFTVGKLRITKDGTVEGKLSKSVLKGLARSGFEPIEDDRYSHSG
ncbi:MAG: recombinase family protein [Lachnospiraceae bacterium]|nr:recombinase family protein [Lachnospiraceae bacterium]